MIFFNKNQLPVSVIGKLNTKYIIDLMGKHPISVDESPTGALYLNLPVSETNNELNCLLTEISIHRLSLISIGEMSIDFPFNNPEKEIVYAAIVNQQTNDVSLSYFNPLIEKIDLPISEQHFIEFDLQQGKTEKNLLQVAQSRNKVIIEFYLQAPSLKEKAKYWSIKQFLIPFVELIKTAIVDSNKNVPAKNMERQLNFGFSKIEIGSLHALCEFDYNLGLFEMNKELDNTINLFELMQAESEEDIIKHFSKFKDKKIIPQYLRVLKSIYTNNAELETNMASPNDKQSQAIFDRRSAFHIKNLIESNLPETEYEETVTGIPTRLDFEKKTKPGFALHSTVDDQVYCGTICQSLQPLIAEQEFNFLNKEYECKLRVTFVPESPKNKENYEYLLLNIKDIG